MPRAELIEADWPDFGMPDLPPPLGAAVYRDRLAEVRRRMAAAGLLRLVVYGDREHIGNLHWLTGFDPRFEEAVLILGAGGAPLLLVGNEGQAYVPVSPLWPDGLRMEVWQPLSLVSQPRGASRHLGEILAAEGLGAGVRTGIAGWKYFGTADGPDPGQMLAVPAFLADAVRSACGPAAVSDATAMFMSPADGLRTIATAHEIALAEHANAVAAGAMRRILTGLGAGMTDHEAVGLAALPGLPLSCHVTFAAGPRAALGLAGASGVRLARGMALSLNVAVWRANCCRAGWIAAGPEKLPAPARDYLDAFAGPYFAAMAEWFASLRTGTPGGAIQALIDRLLPRGTFGITLNPGHLIDVEEWLSSPVFPGSDLPLRSGHLIQIDVIPSSPRHFSTRMEDTVALADAALRAEIARDWPGMAARIAARRRFMAGTLGLALPDEVLPLSDLTGIIAPFFLAPRRILALRPWADPTMTRKIIIDTDAGQDDAIAILLALASPELEVLGITGVAGNVPLPMVARNIRVLCELAGRRDVPCLAGADGPVAGRLVTAEYVHGRTGIDGPVLPEPTLPLDPREAVGFIVETLRREAPGAVTLCTLGPFTNVALALRQAPDIAPRIARIVAMAGAHFEVGNVTPCAEFNVYVDPVAAQEVLHAGIPVTLAPLDVSHKALTTAARIGRLRAGGTRVTEAAAQMIEFFERHDEAKYGTDGAPLHDPLTIAWLLRPGLFGGRDCNVEVECTSPLTRGMSVIDWWGVTDRPRNAHVLGTVDAEGYFDLIAERLARL
jgi:purine nucleosidase